MRDEKLRNIVLGLVACLAYFLCALPVHAQDESGTGPVDAVLVLDASGSMLLTDPQQLRLQGAKLFTQFLTKEDRLAVVGFSREATVYRALEPFSPDQNEIVAKVINEIGSLGEYTDILAGIKSAKSLLDSSARQNARRIIVVLSDGKMEPDPGVGTSESRTSELVSTVLPELKASETKVYTLAFSDQADSALLAEMAGATDGLNWFTTTSDKIHESFANLFLVVKKPQVVPLTSKGFKMDAEIDEATFYINKEDAPEVQIVSPEDETITSTTTRPGLRWFSGQKFEVVTIENPAPGDWKVKGVTSTDGFATVLTDLKLIAEWPSTLRVDEPTILEARLFDAQKPIALPEMSGVVKFGYQITPTDKISEPIIREALIDDGTTGDRVEGDGVLSHEVSLKDPGEYVLTVVAKGPTFQRTQQIPFRVKPKLITLRVETGEGDHGHASGGHGEKHGEHEGGPDESSEPGHENSSEHGHESDHAAAGEQGDDTEGGKQLVKKGIIKGSPKDRIVVELSTEASALRDVKVELSARDSKRRKYDLPLRKQLGEVTTYEFAASGFPEDGLYELKATLDGQTKRKEHIEAATDTLKFQRISSAEDVSDAAVLVVQQREREEKKPDEGPGFPFIPLILVTAVNGALFFFGMKFLDKLDSGSSVDIVHYSPPQEILSTLARLDKIASLTTLEPNDPIFALAMETEPASSGSATADATSAAQAEGEISETSEGS